MTVAPSGSTSSTMIKINRLLTLIYSSWLILSRNSRFERPLKQIKSDHTKFCTDFHWIVTKKFTQKVLPLSLSLWLTLVMFPSQVLLHLSWRTKTTRLESEPSNTAYPLSTQIHLFVRSDTQLNSLIARQSLLITSLQRNWSFTLSP